MLTRDDALRNKHRRWGAQATHHKREARRHRMTAQAARERQAKIGRQCARLGIKLIINSGEEDTSWPGKTPSSISTR